MYAYGIQTLDFFFPYQEKMFYLMIKIFSSLTISVNITNSLIVFLNLTKTEEEKNVLIYLLAISFNLLK